MAAVARRYPTGDDLRRRVERAVPGRVAVRETGYGYSCHVPGLDGGSFLAIDADRRRPEVYFDPASARGRDAVTRAQARHAVNYVVEAVVGSPRAAAAHVRQHAARLARERDAASESPTVPTVLPAEGPSEPVDGEELVANFRAAAEARCQYLHGRRTDATTEKALAAYRRDPLTNDKLGQQFGWRLAAREAATGPDVALEFVAAASHAQVADALSE